MPRLKGKDLRVGWEVDQLKRNLSHFNVVRPGRRELFGIERLAYESERCETLDEARRKAESFGRDEHGRTALIYGVTKNGMSIHLDERHLRALTRGGEDGGKP